jgi:hypothetical protein
VTTPRVALPAFDERGLGDIAGAAESRTGVYGHMALARLEVLPYDEEPNASWELRLRPVFITAPS